MVVVQVYVLRGIDDTGVGLQVEESSSIFLALNVSGAAWRSGIRNGDQVISYHLNPLVSSIERTRDKKPWDGDTINYMELLPPMTPIAIWIKRKDPLIGDWHTRRAFAIRRLLTKYRHCTGASPDDFSKGLIKWEGRHPMESAAQFTLAADWNPSIDNTGDPPLSETDMDLSFDGGDALIDEMVSPGSDVDCCIDIPIQQIDGPVNIFKYRATHGHTMKAIHPDDIMLCCLRFAQTVSYDRFRVVTDVPVSFATITCIVRPTSTPCDIIVILSTPQFSPIAFGNYINDDIRAALPTLRVSVVALIDKQGDAAIQVIDLVRQLSRIAREEAFQSMEAKIQSLIESERPQTPRRVIDDDIVDAFKLSRLREPMWALTVDKSKRDIWWPAREITTRLARQVGFLHGKGCAVVWFRGNPTDTMWVRHDHVFHLRDAEILSDVAMAIRAMRSEDEIRELKKAFNQANTFFGRDPDVHLEI